MHGRTARPRRRRWSRRARGPRRRPPPWRRPSTRWSPRCPTARRRAGGGAVPTACSPARAPGLLVIDMSTIAPDDRARAGVARVRPSASTSSTRRCPAASRAPSTARSRSWSAATRDAFARARPVFAALGRTVTHMGGPGQGQMTKLVNQVVGATTLAAVAEGLTLAAHAGPRSRGGARGGRQRRGDVVDADRTSAPRMQRGDFAPGLHGAPAAEGPATRARGRGGARRRRCRRRRSCTSSSRPSRRTAAATSARRRWSRRSRRWRRRAPFLTPAARGSSRPARMQIDSGAHDGRPAPARRSWRATRRRSATTGSGPPRRGTIRICRARSRRPRPSASRSAPTSPSRSRAARSCTRRSRGTCRPRRAAASSSASARR